VNWLIPVESPISMPKAAGSNSRWTMRAGKVMTLPTEKP
jgi:hypothetical protein